MMINGHVTVYHYNDTRSTMTRLSFDNDQRHVTAFRPISEAAHSWSYDNTLCTYNCRSVKSSVIGIQDLRAKSDLVCLEEHWLLPNPPKEVNFLAHVGLSAYFLAVGSSAVDRS